MAVEAAWKKPSATWESIFRVLFPVAPVHSPCTFTSILCYFLANPLFVLVWGVESPPEPSHLSSLRELTAPDLEHETSIEQPTHPTEEPVETTNRPAELPPHMRLLILESMHDRIQEEIAPMHRRIEELENLLKSREDEASENPNQPLILPIPHRKSRPHTNLHLATSSMPINSQDRAPESPTTETSNNLPQGPRTSNVESSNHSAPPRPGEIQAPVPFEDSPSQKGPTKEVRSAKRKWSQRLFGGRMKGDSNTAPKSPKVDLEIGRIPERNGGGVDGKRTRSSFWRMVGSRVEVVA